MATYTVCTQYNNSNSSSCEDTSADNTDIFKQKDTSIQLHSKMNSETKPKEICADERSKENPTCCDLNTNQVWVNLNDYISNDIKDNDFSDIILYNDYDFVDVNDICPTPLYEYDETSHVKLPEESEKTNAK